MPANDHHERALIARIAAAERWARTPDRAEATQKARAALRSRFENEADPDGTLHPDELQRRADQLMRAHMLRMSLKAVQGRRRASEHTAKAKAAEAALRSLDTGSS